jgi:elongation factor P hydroxylase
MGLAESARRDESEQHVSVRLESVFSRCFAKKYKTRLYGGADEPLYQPATVPGADHALYYRSDYFASALHETAHWCLAGVRRREKTDFGYWYMPETRDIAQQREFEAVECKPQALEWFFSRACSFHFQVSADNLALAQQGALDTSNFQQRVLEQALAWQITGLPIRADAFYTGLCLEFGTQLSAGELRFDDAGIV